MKTTIKLTEEQVQEIVSVKENQLKEQLEKDIQKLKDVFERTITSLRKKFETVDINLTDEVNSEQPKKRTPIDEVELRKLTEEGLSSWAISKKIGKPYATVSAAVKKLGLKETKPANDKPAPKPSKVVKKKK